MSVFWQDRTNPAIVRTKFVPFITELARAYANQPPVFRGRSALPNFRRFIEGRLNQASVANSMAHRDLRSYDTRSPVLRRYAGVSKYSSNPWDYEQIGVNRPYNFDVAVLNRYQKRAKETRAKLLFLGRLYGDVLAMDQLEQYILSHYGIF